MTHYTYRYELRPSKEQEAQLAQDFGSARFVYNHYLNKSIKDYQQDKEKKRSKYEYQRDIVNLKKEHERLKVTNSQSLQASL